MWETNCCRWTFQESKVFWYSIGHPTWILVMGRHKFLPLCPNMDLVGSANTLSKIWLKSWPGNGDAFSIATTGCCPLETSARIKAEHLNLWQGHVGIYSSQYLVGYWPALRSAIEHFCWPTALSTTRVRGKFTQNACYKRCRCSKCPLDARPWHYAGLQWCRCQ